MQRKASVRWASAAASQGRVSSVWRDKGHGKECSAQPERRTVFMKPCSIRTLGYLMKSAGDQFKADKEYTLHSECSKLFKLAVRSYKSRLYQQVPEEMKVAWPLCRILNRLSVGVASNTCSTTNGNTEEA